MQLMQPAIRPCHRTIHALGLSHRDRGGYTISAIATPAPSIAEVLAGYDVTESTTFLQLATCHADKDLATGITVITAVGDIDPADWAEVFDRFPIRTAEYLFDYTIMDDGLEVFMLTEVEADDE